MEEPLVDFLPDYSDSDDGGGTKVVAQHKEPPAELPSSSAPVVATEAKPKRRRRTRVRYTDEEIFKMSAHLAQQMELTPRPSMMEVWHAYAVQNPECGRTVSALLQEHNRHPELFGPVLPKSPPNWDPASQTPQNTDSEPLPPWDAEDEEILLDFIRQHPQIASADWELLQGKSPRRPPQSFRIKYYKNRKAYDEMAHNPSKQPIKSDPDNVDRGPFTWQLPSGYRKRPRSPTTPLNPPARQRRKSSSRGPLYVDESSDAKDSGDDYHERAATNGVTRASRSPATRKSVNGSAKPLRVSTSDLQRSTTEPVSVPPLNHPPISTPSTSAMAITPSATPSWLSEFTVEDKAAALAWVITRRRPNQLLDNFESWIEFAALHPQHSAPEWLCYYLVHLPTFDVVETTLGPV